MDVLQIIMWIVYAILFFIIFIVYIYPKLFGTNMGAFVKQPLHRGNSILIDATIPGGMAEIEERATLSSGEVILHMRNKNGRFIRKYLEDNIRPLSKGQALVDSENPMYITIDTLYAQAEFGKDYNEISERLEKTIQQRDELNKELRNVKANMDNTIKEQVKLALESSKPARPEWPNAQT